MEPLKNFSAFLWKVIDIKIINGTINGVGQFFMIISSIASFRISGNLQSYGLFFILGTFVFLVFFHYLLLSRPCKSFLCHVQPCLASHIQALGAYSQKADATSYEDGNLSNM